jgi:hypothetical protein
LELIFFSPAKIIKEKMNVFHVCMFLWLQRKAINLKETYLVVRMRQRQKRVYNFFSHLAATHFIGQHFIQKYLFKWFKVTPPEQKLSYFSSCNLNRYKFYLPLTHQRWIIWDKSRTIIVLGQNLFATSWKTKFDIV